MTAVAVQRKAEVLDLLISGKRLSDIAPIIGVSHNAISRALKDDPEYRQAIETSFDVRLDYAEDAINDAADNVDVSRARAYHEALKWRAGVECDKFKPKQDIRVTAHIQVDHTLQFDAGTVIDQARSVEDVGVTLGVTDVLPSNEILNNQ